MRRAGPGTSDSAKPGLAPCARVPESTQVKRFPAFLALLAVALAPHAAKACRDMIPDMDSLESYESIFLGEISGVRLREYEDRRLGQPGTCEPDPVDGIECIGAISGSPGVSLFVIPTKVIRGKVVGVQELQQAGCVRTNVRLKEEAIFFVNPGGSAVIVWRSRLHDYAEVLGRLDVDEGVR